jgi:ribonucleotide monophosphatase NagD (HAD superfamily)
VSGPERLSLDQLLARGQGVLLDAYGVLVDAEGAKRGATALIDRLQREGRPWLVLTNDASRLPATAARHYQAAGLAIPEDRVLTAGSLLGGYYLERGLAGAKSVVFGPPDSRRYVELAGGRIVEPDQEPEVVAICDEAAEDFLGRLDAIVSAVIAAVDAGRPIELVLANPDLIYPKRVGFGIAAGSIGGLIEQVLTLRFGAAAPRFTRLGKPFAPIFEQAARRLGTRDLVMIGDQIDTDVVGANRFGITSALLEGGVGRDRGEVGDRAPAVILSSL